MIQLEALAQLGVALILFSLGLELDLTRIAHVRYVPSNLPRGFQGFGFVNPFRAGFFSDLGYGSGLLMVKSSPGVTPKPRFGPNLDLTGVCVFVCVFAMPVAILFFFVEKSSLSSMFHDGLSGLELDLTRIAHVQYVSVCVRLCFFGVGRCVFVFLLCCS